MRSISQVAKALHEVFGNCADEADQATQVVQRTRKLTPRILARTFVLAYLQNPEARSTHIAAMAANIGVDVSPQAVDQRFTPRLAAFFEHLFRRMTRVVVGADKALAPLLERFTRVVVLDSTTIALPDTQRERFRGCGGAAGRGEAALKLQTELDLRTGALRSIRIEEGRQTDVATVLQHAPAEKGLLRIADLGYFSLSVFAALAGAGAFFLSRAQYHTSLWIDGRKTGLVDWLKGCGEAIVDREVELGAGQRLACRLIAWRLPAEMVAQRRRKLRRKHQKKTGGTPCQAALEACGWMFLVTNVPPERMSVTEAAVLYRSRWQIELLFKRWKSLGHIDRFEPEGDIAGMVKFWVRLCAVLAQHWLTVAAAWSPERNLSLSRITRLTREVAVQLGWALSLPGRRRLEEVVELLARMARSACRRNKRSQPGTFELLRNPELLNYAFSP